MKKLIVDKWIGFLFFGIFLFSSGLMAQDEYPYPSLSPKGTITQVIGNTTLQIEYERPSARKRKIFGELVPWDKVWRTGAGKCTKISFDQPVKIGGQILESGTYALFSIPNPEEWIIILNKDTSLYGSYDYNPTKDAVRFVVIPQTSSRYYESLNFDVELIPNNAIVYLSWENTQVAFEVGTTTDQKIEELIQEDLLTGKQTKSDIYAGAAEYYLYQNTNFTEAILLADKALEINKDNGWARDLKIRIYERLKWYDRALNEIEKTIKIIEQANYDNEVGRQAELKNLRSRSQTLKGKATIKQR